MREKRLKCMTYISFIFFIMLLLPIIYLTFVNRATGDDYGYAVYTRMAWVNTHSIMAVVRAMCETVRLFYYGWQGTWFSIAVFSLQPEVFHDEAYVIVAILMLFFWIGSTFCLFRQVLYVRGRFNKCSYLFVTVCFLIISIEFIPSTRSSIYWFNGCAHYMIPFAMCQMVAVWLFKYSRDYGKNTFAGILIFMTLLGGSNYQAALCALIMAFYVCVSVWVIKKNKRIFTLCIPTAAELAGLVVSMKSPGNIVRAGDEFGFSMIRAIETIGYSFVYAVKDIGTYIQERPLSLVGLLFIFIVFVVEFCFIQDNLKIQHRGLIVLMLFCLYSAMQAPAIYAGVEVSGGVPNTNFQMFMLSATMSLLLAADKLAGLLKRVWKDEADKKICRFIVIPGILICVMLTYGFRRNVKTSTSYVALTYITSGQAQDYKQQMDLQTMLMEDENAEDIVVPGINDVQGPLMHMPITDNKDAFTNWATGNFYGKRSVVAIERSKWIELYGGDQDEKD